jgi:hypothetical protein
MNYEGKARMPTQEDRENLNSDCVGKKPKT